MANVRTAKMTDLQQIHYLSNFLGYENASMEQAQLRLEYLLESNNDDVWVFDQNGRVGGWIHAFKAHRVASKMVYEIGGLVVDPKIRNQGIGKQLVEHVYQVAIEQNTELRVRCNEKRIETHHFYLKLGFSESKTQHVFTKN
ncbi:GNAT family N-acetyltransferase [Pseudoalteromonas sp. Of7M-16]|uniref:GNAT family N-acetyltransferase n=1 Tax=Pseudoalteromonas sp. Of7M-16 TaxID=2917756 RepID=UPI001EF683DC|nr:GNAT family N-acetyltransferase [Pseudoalteromonas sp. Of7M-16]MCG7547561.1 GNAT family N-acetyltransferase [Pseudoalteromonas sp. Of7M-16]